ncbi:fatty acyl-CoA reductase 1-like [Agrilus planipennis]|uniref:Fatty acyl-CoA reductase n=1 Tax=Agrilus planipennis TaxID=224129 RepID=A0A7F5RE25_AGRPL|nr:fatty acyl-CoA reductase 1-like [Agrilus planipennis]
MLDMVQWMDEDILDVLTRPLLKNAPNTYAYTKCLTEELVGEYSSQLPIAIARPSIVTAAWKEPIPGWVDNLNGPTGLIVGAGKGVIRTMHCDASLEADIMPVDVSINGLILAAWKVGNNPPSDEPLVVNVTSYKKVKL